MGRSCFLKLPLVLALLLLSISHGFGRKILIDTVDVGNSSVPEQEVSGTDRKMVEVLDYQDPEPNTNPRTGFIYGPSPRKSGSQKSVNGSSLGFPPQVPGYPDAPWPYPWSTAQWSSPVVSPTFCPAAPAGFPMPFYPAATYWGCVVPGAWSIPWLPHPSSPKQTGLSSAPNSPTLGKHSRDENMPKSNNSAEYEPAKGNNGERCLWIPKTLRIDDPSEAAKSSIWTTLGIKNERANSIGGKGVFNAFQSKGGEENDISESSPVLQANPAALSRSLQFHETS